MIAVIPPSIAYNKDMDSINEVWVPPHWISAVLTSPTYNKDGDSINEGCVPPCLIASVTPSLIVAVKAGRLCSAFGCQATTIYDGINTLESIDIICRVKKKTH